MKNVFIRASILGLALGVASMGSLYAQNSHPAQNDQQSAQSQTSTQQNSAKEFTGTIVKDGDNMMLKDSASSTSYKVDDASKVKEYVGKQVKVTGTVDSSTNTIHVDSIQVIS
jgi:Protein of unknown function (DUF5818)